MAINLTQDQQDAYEAIISMVTGKTSNTELVLDGYAGTGKTTLVKTFIDEWKTVINLSAGAIKPIEMFLTATTNKAADALRSATGIEATTIHSLLGLRVQNIGYNKAKLVDNGKTVPNGCLIFIDEASFIDLRLLSKIREKTKRCFVVYMGDPCQLKPVGSDDTPVFTSGVPTQYLKQIVRQTAGSPIQALSKALRDHVEGSPMPKAGVNGVDIIHLPHDDFKKAMISDFANRNGSIRALAWTNQAALGYNAEVALALSGDTDFKLGDVLVVNKQIIVSSTFKLATDSTVNVLGLGKWETDSNGIISREVVVNPGISLRQAQVLNGAADLIIQAYKDKDLGAAFRLENTYADLRLMYASTINKAQGSTYDTVYIDLTDIGKCSDKDQVRRMLYVAVSRAKNKVVFTGDI